MRYILVFQFYLFVYVYQRQQVSKIGIKIRRVIKRRIFQSSSHHVLFGNDANETEGFAAGILELVQLPAADKDNIKGFDIENLIGDLRLAFAVKDDNFMLLRVSFEFAVAAGIHAEIAHDVIWGVFLGSNQNMLGDEFQAFIGQRLAVNSLPAEIVRFACEFMNN